jgi:hypothetical protein
MAGRLGERLLAQQSELETRIRELEDDESPVSEAKTLESDGEGSVDEDIKRKLDALESETRKWGRGNEQIYRLVNGPDEKSLLDVGILSVRFLSDIADIKCVNRNRPLHHRPTLLGLCSCQQTTLLVHLRPSQLPAAHATIPKPGPPIWSSLQKSASPS